MEGLTRCHQGLVSCEADQYCDQIMDECRSCKNLCGHPLRTLDGSSLQTCAEKCTDFFLRMLRENFLVPTEYLTEPCLVHNLWAWVVFGLLGLLVVILFLIVLYMSSVPRQLVNFVKGIKIYTRVPNKDGENNLNLDSVDVRASGDSNLKVPPDGTIVTPNEVEFEDGAGVRGNNDLTDKRIAVPAEEGCAETDNIRPECLIQGDQETRRMMTFPETDLP